MDPPATSEMSLRRRQRYHRRLDKMRGYSSMDYDVGGSVVEEEWQHSKTKEVLAWEERAEAGGGDTHGRGVGDAWHSVKWFVAAAVGVLCGFMASIVDWIILAVDSWRVDAAHYLLGHHRGSDGDARAFFAYMAVALSMSAAAATICAFVEPLAAGSGIPSVLAWEDRLDCGARGRYVTQELKTYLNGVHIPRLLRLRTLGAKLLGIITSIGAGLVAGKEGPFVHAGAIVAVGLSQMASPSLGFDLRLKWMSHLRNDVDKREFAAIGTAAGVACAFGAPIGGILFAVEEGVSFYSTGIMWRGFLATSIGVLTLQALFQLRSNSLKGVMQSHFGVHRELGLYNDDQAHYNQNLWWYVWEIPIFVMMGITQGCVGALFVGVNKRLSLWRMRFIPIRAPWRRLLEVLAIAMVTSMLVLVATMASPCKDLPSTLWPNAILRQQMQRASGDDGDALAFGHVDLMYIKRQYYKQWWCGAEQYSTRGQLLMSPLASSFKLLCHLGEFQLGTQDYEFTLDALFTFYFIALGLMLWTYGAGCAMGLFVPSLAVGAAFGQVVGLGTRAAVVQYPTLQPNLHAYAIIGAAGMLGGVTRMTVSCTVLVMETTGSLQLLVPIMLTVFAAKWAGDLLSRGIYDTHMQIRGAPYLAEHNYSSLKGDSLMAAKKLRAHEVIATQGALVTLPPVVTLQTLLDQLHRYTFGAFAVTPDAPTAENPAFPLHGAITRIRLLRMCQYRIGILEPGEDTFVLPTERDALAQLMSNLDDSNPEAAGLDEISIPEEMLQQRMDLRPFMQRHVFTVDKNVSLSRAYRLFRTMGLRHLFITAESQPTVMGCITRKDIIEEHAELVLGERDGRGSTVSLNPLSSSLELVDAHAPPVSSRPHVEGNGSV